MFAIPLKSNSDDGLADGKVTSEFATPRASENASTPLMPQPTPGESPPAIDNEPQNEKRPAIPDAEKPGAVDL